MKTRRLVVSTLLAATLAFTGFGVSAAPHDCASHCASHSDKDAKMCVDHCKTGMPADHACATHCAAQSADDKDQMCAKHCANS